MIMADVGVGNPGLRFLLEGGSRVPRFKTENKKVADKNF